MFALALFGMFSSTFISVIGAVYIHEDITLREIIRLFSTQSTLNAIQVHELIFGSALILCVIAYAYFHKRIGKGALFLMASCRFMLVLYAISTAYKGFFSKTNLASDLLIIHTDWLENWMLLLAFAIGAYTLLLSWVASTESDKKVF